jgi:hypothetical protein
VLETVSASPEALAEALVQQLLGAR